MIAVNLLPHQKWLLVLSFLFLLATSGCVFDSTETPIDRTDEHRAEPGYFDERFTYHQDGPYGVNGTLFFDMPGNEVAEFESVMLCTYDSDGTVLDATNLGTISAPSEVEEVRMFVDRQPRYIVIDHPGFAEYEFPDDPSISPLTIEWTDDAISIRHQKAEAVIDEFDYERPDEPGECYRGG